MFPRLRQRTTDALYSNCFASVAWEPSAQEERAIAQSRQDSPTKEPCRPCAVFDRWYKRRSTAEGAFTPVLDRLFGAIHLCRRGYLYAEAEGVLTVPSGSAQKTVQDSISAGSPAGYWRSGACIDRRRTKDDPARGARVGPLHSGEGGVRGGAG